MGARRLTEKNAEVRSRQIIQAGFAIVLIVIFSVVYFGVNRLGRMHDSLREIVSHEQVAMEMLFHMQEAARNRSVLLFKISAIKDPFERDEQILLHSKMGGQFVRARLRLSGLNLDATEKDLLEKIKSSVVINQKVQDRVLDELTADRLQSAQQILANEAIPVQQSLLDSIRVLLEYEIGKSHESEQFLEKQQGQNTFLLIAGGVVASIIALLIAVFINRRMNHLVGGLSASAHELEEANQRLQSLNLAMDQHSIVSITDARGKITYVNEKFCQISGYTREELLGQNHRIINSGVHPKMFFRSMWATISSGNVWQGEVCNRSKSGKEYWVYSTVVPFLNNLDMPFQYISVRTDITAIKQAELVLMRGKQELEELVHERTAELEEREEVLQSITRAAQDAVMMMDNEGNVTHWNPAAETLFGYTQLEALGCNLHDLIAPVRYHDAHRAGFAKFMKSGAGPLVGAVTEVDAKRKNGAEFPAEISLASVQVRGNWHAVAIVRDITGRKQAEENLKLLASTDTLTGAYNRRKFNEVLQVELARAKRYGTSFSVLIFDVDHFKRINDVYGHQVGDQVLLKIALLVTGNIRQTDIFARWGGEEFVVLAAHCDTECPSAFADKLRKLIEQYAFDQVGRVTCSFGVTVYRHGDAEESLLKRVDDYLYRAKEAGRNCVVFEDHLI